MNQKELKESLDYNPNTGVFIWKVNNSNKQRRIGDIAGCLVKDGYRRISIKRKLYQAHHLAWLYIYGEFPKREIDHINHKVDDNRIKNLRDVTHLENGQNKLIHSNNTSGITGVHWHKKDKKWNAYITVNNMFKHLGSFIDINEAKKAREQAKIKYGFHVNHA